MKIGEYELESPLINGGGVVKTPNDALRMSTTGVGAVLGGSFTQYDRVGFSTTGEMVYNYDPVTGITYNCLSLPNAGIKLLTRFLPDMIQISHDAGKPFILNMAPVTDDPVGEIGSMFEILGSAKIENLDAVELNAGCPSVLLRDGRRHEILSHRHQLLGEVLLKMNDIKASVVPFGTTLVRVSPFTEAGEALILAKILKETGTQAVSAFNTFPGGMRLGLIGGLSGPGMTVKAEEQTRWLVKAKKEVNGNFDIIGSNGIYDAKSMKRRLDMDVAAVSATTLFYEAKSWGSAVRQLLQEYAELV